MTTGPAWPQHDLAALGLRVGPCAWHATMLAGAHTGYVREHPSLVVIGPDDDEATLRAAAPHLTGLPVLLGLREPAFARRLPDLINQRLQWIGRLRVEVIALWVDQVLDLKTGGMLQALMKFREAGVTPNVGLALANAADAEWAATHTTARLLAFPYHLADQSARYRVLDAAKQYGMACLATGPADHGRLTSAATDGQTLRFSLAEAARALPVLDRSLPEPWPVMNQAEIDAVWQAYSESHPPPPGLRGGPPEGIG